MSLYFNLCTELLCLRLPGATSYDERAGLVSPAVLTNEGTLTRGDESSMNPRRISWNSVPANFGEYPFHALR